MKFGWFSEIIEGFLSKFKVCAGFVEARGLALLSPDLARAIPMKSKGHEVKVFVNYVDCLNRYHLVASSGDSDF